VRFNLETVKANARDTTQRVYLTWKRQLNAPENVFTRPRRDRKHVSRQPSGRFAQACLHECLAFVAFLGAGLLIANFHFFLLCGAVMSAQALLHERFALIALFARGLLVAGGHPLLLRVKRFATGGMGQIAAASQTQSRNQREKRFHGVGTSDKKVD
jgi:hypothetical protein